MAAISLEILPNGMHVETPDLGTLRGVPGGDHIEILDQTRLPHVRSTLSLFTVAEAAHAIQAMQVRGAPLIGATAAYGLALALRRAGGGAAPEAAGATRAPPP